MEVPDNFEDVRHVGDTKSVGQKLFVIVRSLTAKDNIIFLEKSRLAV